MSKPKTITITAKCSDCFGAYLYDAEGKEMGAYDGYVLGGLGIGGGDYIELELDVETGQLVKPVPADPSALRQLLATETLSERGEG